ncbi:MAG: NADH-quinone oxidoreductase subunit H [Fibrobacteres bacterium]|nr:NADH-quinone oxidoreductase subunit H [Fibrobacterota bacterium]
MDNILSIIIPALAFIIGAPLVGGFLSGADRIISARMQRRVGPPIWQSFFDVFKLLQKETVVVRPSQNVFIVFFLVFVIFTGVLFFTGGDLLLVIFSLALASIFLVLAGYKGSSPYSFIGAERELLQIMSYEPMVLIMAIAFYMVTDSFNVCEIMSHPVSLVTVLPGVFAGFLFILTIKLRKSPFDLSTSHHAHQEIVKGVTTEYSGRALAMIEIAHWYELVLILGFIYLFFAQNIVLGVVAALAAYFLEILVDNSTARLRWQWMLIGAWVVALIFGGGNILALYLMR